MKIKFPLLSALAATALSISVTLPAFAESGVLSGLQSGSRVNVRSQPTAESSSRHYGLVGDRIEIIKDARGYDGNTWYYVRFPSGAEGWVRGDFVTVPVSYPGNGYPGYPSNDYPDHPSDSGYGRGRNIATFQTSNYSVKVFRHRGELYMSVYNKRTGSQELSWARAEAVTSARGTSYFSSSRQYGYNVSRTSNGRYVLEVRYHGRLVARERGFQVY